jgi:hypothetical protein
VPQSRQASEHPTTSQGERRTTRKKQDGQPVKGHPVYVEGNDHVSVDAVLEIDKKHKRRGRPRLTKVCQLINEVFNELLSDFEVTDGEDENIFYDSYEVRKENDGTAN